MKVRLLPFILMMLICFFGFKMNFFLQNGIEVFAIPLSFAFSEGDGESAKEEGKEEKKQEVDNSVTKTYDKSKGALIEDLSQKRDSEKDRKIRGMTDVEIDVLQSLSKRREELDRREKDIALRESALKVLQNNIDAKISELNKLQNKIEGVLSQYNEQEDSKILGLVKIYEAMKPQEAAKIFDQMELSILISICANMNEAKLAQIMAKMDPYRAKEITIELANRRKVKM